MVAVKMDTTAKTSGVSSPELHFNDPKAAFAHQSTTQLRLARLIFSTLSKPWLASTGTALVRTGLALHVPLVGAALEQTVFRLFCGGRTLDEAARTARELHGFGVGTILDYAVEGSKDIAGFDATRNQLIEALRFAAGHQEIKYCALKMTGLAPFAVLEKRHLGQAFSDEERAAWQRVNARLDVIAAVAAQSQVPIFVDAEESWIDGAIDEICLLLMRRYNRERATVFPTVQLYLQNGIAKLEGFIRAAKEDGFVLGVKLVRGAYLEKEAERAARLAYPSPLQPSKDACDADFNRAVTLCLENLSHVNVVVATHNEASIRHTVAQMQRLGIAPHDERVGMAQLLGMFDRLTMPLAAHGFNSLKYVPYGELREVIPYLMRRADENKSVAQQTRAEVALIDQELERRASAKR